MKILNPISDTLPKLQFCNNWIAFVFGMGIFMRKNKETWKDIPNYVGFYQISNLGNVRSLEREITRRDGLIKRFHSQRLRPGIASNGYLTVSLSKNGIGTTYLIHRMIGDAFILNTKNKAEINHKDGNKLNNSISNLEWVSSSENSIHAHKSGLIIFTSERRHNHSISKKGIKNPASKLTEKDIIDIKSLLETKKQKEISAIYNINQSVVSRIKNNKTWIKV